MVADVTQPGKGSLRKNKDAHPYTHNHHNILIGPVLNPSKSGASEGLVREFKNMWVLDSLINKKKKGNCHVLLNQKSGRLADPTEPPRKAEEQGNYPNSGGGTKMCLFNKTGM